MKARSTAANAVASMQRSGAYNSPADTKVSNSSALKSKLPKKLKSDTKVASAVAAALAAATARSVLREVNKGASTPPLSAMGVPKLMSCTREAASRGGDQPANVIKSLRRRQFFDSGDEN
ncbi:unnamed protein product [Fraxinus pennsylvanica]|uniref:Uncharacterized protein n=1 Tax=Fraxinus pennsylvanica TaxID=56036 RepID=A0AAD2A1K9_9LAMI|nr:unnamed protein product [Fraxinus pennsylvanica]